MNAISFDTRAAANALEGAGFTKAQVEALVEISWQTTSLPDISTLATKGDLAEVRVEIAAAKVQVITILISAMAVFTAAGALIGKLIH